jgi:hypothetical protein
MLKIGILFLQINKLTKSKFLFLLRNKIAYPRCGQFFFLPTAGLRAIASAA